MFCVSHVALVLGFCVAAGMHRVVSGEVVIELRRGEDYTILDTRGPHLTWRPERRALQNQGRHDMSRKSIHIASGADPV